MSIELKNIQLKNIETSNFKPKENSAARSKSSLNATNLILGSLAAIGVLGVADILLCKGKHINKLSGKSKELEEAVTRATTAEVRAASAETKAASLENKIASVEDEFNTFVEHLKKYQEGEDANFISFLDESFDKKELLEKLKRLNEQKGCLLDELFTHQKRTVKIGDGCNKDVLGWFQRLYSDNNGLEAKELEREINKIMNFKGYEFVKYSPELEEGAFEVSKANVNSIITSKYAVRDKTTGKIVLPGIVVKPKGS